MAVELSYSILNGIVKTLLFVLVSYPVLGAFIWLIEVVFYRFFYRYKRTTFRKIPISDEPFVTIMVPAHNEEIVLEDTLTYLLNELNYHNYEVLVTDDGSTDQTPEILARLQSRYPRLRVLRIERIEEKLMPLILAWVLPRVSTY